MVDQFMGRRPSPAKTCLGEALRTRRVAASGASAAEELGLDHDHFYRLERGQHRPTVDTARKLAAWLGWTLEQVLDAADTPLAPS
jgi:DNA-binding XRE family transcriptional regulator